MILELIWVSTLGHQDSWTSCINVNANSLDQFLKYTVQILPTRGKERDRPQNSIPAGSTHNNIANGMFTDIVNKCTWNINVMDDCLLCNYLKMAKNTNISFEQVDLKCIFWMNRGENNPN